MTESMLKRQEKLTPTCLKLTLDIFATRVPCSLRPSLGMTHYVKGPFKTQYLRVLGIIGVSVS